LGLSVPAKHANFALVPRLTKGKSVLASAPLETLKPAQQAQQNGMKKVDATDATTIFQVLVKQFSPHGIHD
jgi:hypothetical protein